jgi:hypothetical protein
MREDLRSRFSTHHGLVRSLQPSREKPARVPRADIAP